MYSNRAAAQYRAVRNHGTIAEASPTRLVQIMFENILSELATTQGCIGRIKDNLPLKEVVQKGKSINKAIRLINALNATLDMERGQSVAGNLRNLYQYMLEQLTVANVQNDARRVAEVSSLVQTIKLGWDKVVENESRR